MFRVRAALLTLPLALTLVAQPAAATSPTSPTTPATPTASAALATLTATPTSPAGFTTPASPATPTSPAGLTTPASPATPFDLGRAIDEVLADPALVGSQAGVVVADARTGATLVDRGGARRLLPASNAKLFTSAAALAVLGPGHRFATEALGSRRGNAVDGDLYLRGEGDPALSPADLDTLARDVAATGLREVTGDLVADDTAFDTQRLGLEWAWDDETSSSAAPISALTLAPDENYLSGTVNVEVAPARSDGRKARVSISPPSKQLTVINHAVTVREGPGISVTRGHGTNTLTVTGRVVAGEAPVVEPVTVLDPTALVADVFGAALRRHGVRVKGRVVSGKPTPADVVPLARHDGRPLRELIAPLLKRSNNAMSELLVKAVGRKAAGSGSWPAGTNAVAAYLARLGVDTTTMRQVDGSGLSRRNLVPPAAFARFLVAVRAEPWFPLWHSALPVAGNPDPMIGGTLRNRMRDTPAAGNVHAKTGTLTGASALSGYVTGPDHRPLVFSAIVNNQLSPSVTPHLDRIAVALADPSRVTARMDDIVGPAL